MLTLFLNHFKSQLAKTQQEKVRGKEKRRRQVEWVANMLTKRYGPDLRGGDFVVLGDFNADHDTEELQSLLGLDLENVVHTRHLEIPKQSTVSDTDRWTHYFEQENSVSQLDYILLSPTLREKSIQEKVIIEKRGLANYVKPYKGERFPTVGPRDTEASDHCAVFTTLQI